MTIAALWTKHRRIAYKAAAAFHIPGQDADDTRQDALVALWEAARAYDPTRGPFAPFAQVVVTRRLTDRLKAETRMCRHAPTAELIEVAAPDQREGREQLQLCLDRLPSLTPLQREVVAAKLNGTYDSGCKRQDNALYLARRKLRAA